VHAQVVHEIPYIGLGVRFLGLTATHRAQLARLIDQKSHD